MARKAEADFNTQVHDIFQRVGHGEKSPHRLTRKELAAVAKAAEESTEARKEDQDKEG